MTALNYEGYTLLVLSGVCSIFSIYSLTTAMGIPVGILSASNSLVFLISNGTIKMFLKTMVREKKNKRTRSKIVLGGR